MRCTPEASVRILDEAKKILQNNEPDDVKLVRLWHTLAVLRASILAGMLRNTIGTQVYDGPFKGMQLSPEILKGIFGPVLTGHYEHELHETFEHVIARPYKRILNIGCAFGYYAVGLALRMPQMEVFAFDIVEGEQERCRQMAALNNVADRVHVGGLFKGEDFANYADGKTLVIMDIEGAEKDLLDPARYPALQKMDVVVELHDVLGESLSKIIPSRFSATHDVEIIYNKNHLFDFESLIGRETYIPPLDSIIMTWENRSGPTPWGVMWAK